MIKFGYDTKKKLGIVSGDLFDEIREHFSVKNEAAHFMRRRGRFMPSRTYAITPTGRFEPCLYIEIKKFLTSQQYVGEIEYCAEIFDQVVPARHGWHQQLDFKNEIYPLNLELRDYQKEIVNECLFNGRGTIILATAGGKTLTSASLISKIHQLFMSSYNKQSFKCLFIVPDRGLASQTHQDFIDYGVPFSVSKWTGDDDLDLSSNVIVSNLGILQSKNSNLNWLEDIDLLIVDECLRSNTLITTDKGYKKIQDIKVGDIVKSYNCSTHKEELKPVINTWKNLIKSNSYTYFLEIELENGSLIQVTPNHKIYTSRGMVRADELKLTDDVLSVKSSKFMYLRHKYLYAKKSLQTYLLNMRRYITISKPTSKIQSP
jgi:Type III restriction enzyme, res subunit/Pretoxin HINT domain